MTTFILILHFWAGWGSCVTQIEGFKTFDDCNHAYKEIVRQFDSKISINGACVEKP